MSNVYKIPYERSFASHEKAKFWHPTMNEDWQQILHSFIKKKYVNNNEIEIYDACAW